MGCPNWLLISCFLASVGMGACSSEMMDPTAEALCGNNTIERGEGCDDGNTDNADACTNACEIARCGDAVTRVDLSANNDAAEQCDDGNDVDHDACRTNCRAPPPRAQTTNPTPRRQPQDAHRPTILRKRAHSAHIRRGTGSVSGNGRTSEDHQPESP